MPLHQQYGINKHKFKKQLTMGNFSFSYDVIQHLKYKIPLCSYLYIKNNNLVAYAILNKHEDNIWLEFLDVSDEYHNMGYGSKIMNNIVKDFPEIYVHSVMNTEKFYEKYGFKYLSRFRDENEVFMVRSDKYLSIYDEWNSDY